MNHTNSTPNWNTCSAVGGRTDRAPGGPVAVAVASVLGLILSLPAAPADASEKSEAKRHFENGVSLLKSGDEEAAVVEFDTSVKLFPTKSAFFNLASTYKTLKRYDEALTTLELLRGEFGDALGAAMSAAADELEAEIRGMVATVHVEVAQPGAELLLDGQLVGRAPLRRPLLIAPGFHELAARLDGFEPGKKEFKVVSGDEITVGLVLTRAAADSGSGSDDSEGDGLSPLFWIGAAATVAMGTTAGVFAGLNRASTDDYETLRETYVAMDADDPDGPETYGEMKSARDDAEQQKKIAVGTGVAAGVLAAATIIVLIVDLKTDGEESDTARLEPTPGGFRVTF